MHLVFRDGQAVRRDGSPVMMRIVAAVLATAVVFGGSLSSAPAGFAEEGGVSNAPVDVTAQDPAPSESEPSAEAAAAAAVLTGEPLAQPSPAAAAESANITNLKLVPESKLANGDASPGSQYRMSLLISASWNASINVRIPFFSGSGDSYVDYSQYFDFAVDNADGYLSEDGAPFNFELVNVDGKKYIQLVNPQFAEPDGGATVEYTFKVGVKQGIVPNGTSITLQAHIYEDDTFEAEIPLSDSIATPVNITVASALNTWTTSSVAMNSAASTSLEEANLNADLSALYFSQLVSPVTTTGVGKVWAENVSRVYTVTLNEPITPGTHVTASSLMGGTSLANASLGATPIPSEQISYDEATRTLTIIADSPRTNITSELPAYRYGVKIEGLHLGAMELNSSTTVTVKSATRVQGIGGAPSAGLSEMTQSLTFSYNAKQQAGKYVDNMRITDAITQVCDDGVGSAQKCVASHSQPGNDWSATHTITNFSNENGANLEDFYFVQLYTGVTNFAPSSLHTGSYVNPGAAASQSYRILYTTDAKVDPVSKTSGSAGYYDYKNNGINWQPLTTKPMDAADTVLPLPAGVTAVMWDFGTVGGSSYNDVLGSPDRTNSFRYTVAPSTTVTFTSNITARYSASAVTAVLHYVDPTFEANYTGAAQNTRYRMRSAGFTQRFANHNLSQTEPKNTFEFCTHEGTSGGISTCFPGDVAQYSLSVLNEGWAGSAGRSATPELRIDAPKLYATLDEYNDASTLTVESAKITGGSHPRTLNTEDVAMTVSGQNIVFSVPSLRIVYGETLKITYTVAVQDEAFIVAAKQENDRLLDETLNSNTWITGMTVSPFGHSVTMMPMPNYYNPAIDTNRKAYAAPTKTQLSVTSITRIRRHVPTTSVFIEQWDAASESFTSAPAPFIEEYAPVKMRMSAINRNDQLRKKDIRSDEFTLRAVLPKDVDMTFVMRDDADLSAYKIVNGTRVSVAVVAQPNIVDPTRNVVFRFPGTTLDIGETINVEFLTRTQYLSANSHYSPVVTHAGVGAYFDVDYTKQPQIPFAGDASAPSVFQNPYSSQAAKWLRNPFTSQKYVQQSMKWSSDHFYFGEKITGRFVTKTFPQQSPHPASTAVPVPSVGVSYTPSISFTGVQSASVLDAQGNILIPSNELTTTVVIPPANATPTATTGFVNIQVRHHGEIVKLSNGEQLVVDINAQIKPWRLSAATQDTVGAPDSRNTVFASYMYLYVDAADPVSIKPVTSSTGYWGVDTSDLDGDTATSRLISTPVATQTLVRDVYRAPGVTIATSNGDSIFSGGQANKWVAKVSNNGTAPLTSYTLVAAMPKVMSYTDDATISDTDSRPWQNYAPTAQFTAGGQTLLAWKFGGDGGYPLSGSGAVNVQFAMRSPNVITAYEPEVYLIPGDVIDDAVRQAVGAPGRAIDQRLVPFLPELATQTAENFSQRIVIKNSLVTNSSGTLELIYGGAKPDVTDAAPGQTVKYTFTVGSRGAYAFGDIAALDVFPAIGDRGVTQNSSRGSTMSATFTGEVTVKECNLNGSACIDVPGDKYQVYSSTTDFTDTTIGALRPQFNSAYLQEHYGFTPGAQAGATAAFVELDPAFSVGTGSQLQVQFSVEMPSIEQVVAFYGDEFSIDDKYTLEPLVAANSLAGIMDYTSAKVNGDLNAIETPASQLQLSVSSLGNRVWSDYYDTGIQEHDASGSFTQPGWSGAQLTLQSLDTPGRSYQTTSDNEGNYQFLNPEDGRYQLQVEIPATVNGIDYTFSGMPDAEQAETPAAQANKRMATLFTGSSEAAPGGVGSEYLRLRSEITSVTRTEESVIGTTEPFTVHGGLIDNILDIGITPAAASVFSSFTPHANPTTLSPQQSSTITGTGADQYGTAIVIPDDTLRITAGLETGDIVNGNIVTFGETLGKRTLTVETEINGVTLSGTVDVTVIAKPGGSTDATSSTAATANANATSHAASNANTNNATAANATSSATADAATANTNANGSQLSVTGSSGGTGTVIALTAALLLGGSMLLIGARRRKRAGA